jgi:hypothetical protein
MALKRFHGKQSFDQIEGPPPALCAAFWLIPAWFLLKLGGELA